MNHDVNLFNFNELGGHENVSTMTQYACQPIKNLDEEIMQIEKIKGIDYKTMRL